METSASFEARYAPSLYPTEGPKRKDLPHNGAESIDFLAGNRHGMPTSL